jgi:hypothetical protein
MAAPEAVTPEVSPLEPAATLVGADIPMVINDVTLAPVFYASGDIDPDEPGIGIAATTDEVITLGADEPTNDIYRDFFGKVNSTEYEAQDFFTKIDGGSVAIRTISFLFPDINTFFWVNPFTQFSGLTSDVTEDFFGVATAPADEDFFTLLDELGCKVGSTIWDIDLGYTTWDDFGTCWDEPV